MTTRRKLRKEVYTSVRLDAEMAEVVDRLAASLEGNRSAAIRRLLRLAIRAGLAEPLTPPAGQPAAPRPES